MNIGIIGAGTMGIGIAQVAATNGCKVWVYDANAKQVVTATVGLEKTLTKLVDKQKISSEKMVEILSNISIATELKDFKDCELVIEAIIENKEIKTKVFTELECCKKSEIEGLNLFLNNNPNEKINPNTLAKTIIACIVSENWKSSSANSIEKPSAVSAVCWTENFAVDWLAWLILLG